MVELTILYKPNENEYDDLLSLFATADKCHFCSGIVFKKYEFGIYTTDGMGLCSDCCSRHDPQLFNILHFIAAPGPLEGRLLKYNMGIPHWRKTIAADDQNAEVCPLCKAKRVRRKVCANCGFKNLGEGLFQIHDKVLTYPRALKALKMKIFI